MPWCARTHETAVRDAGPAAGPSLPNFTGVRHGYDSANSQYRCPQPCGNFHPAALWGRRLAGHRRWHPPGHRSGHLVALRPAGNVATSQNNIFNAGSVLYLAGFCVLMFALIAVHGRQAHRAGRLGTFGFSAAVLGTMLFGGDLWFESFAVPWLAEGPLPEVLKSDPSMLFALGAIVS